jgi:hypothetical protein
VSLYHAIFDLPSAMPELLLDDPDRIGRVIAVKQAIGFGLAHDWMAAWGGG